MICMLIKAELFHQQLLTIYLSISLLNRIIPEKIHCDISMCLGAIADISLDVISEYVVKHTMFFADVDNGCRIYDENH